MTWRSSTTISGDLRAGRWRGQASIDWWRGSAPTMSAPCCVSTLRGSPATGATGITCWSSAVLWARASSISTGFMTLAARLLLGMKGSISEFELGVLRARMYDAARSKARHGELRISVPVGYVWHREMGLGLDPDMPLQEAIRLIFARFREMGSARQVLLALAADQLHFPRPSDGKRMMAFDWTPIRYRNVISVLNNPFYAGACIYGKSEHRTAIVNGRAQKTYGHGRPFEEWEVVLKDHHEGYIDWAEFERNQKLLAANAYGRVGEVKSGRGGQALLIGLLRCARCGGRLKTAYYGRSGWAIAATVQTLCSAPRVA